jgi:hypothetical protein
MKPTRQHPDTELGNGFKGKEVEFQDEGTGTIAEETVDSLYIVSAFFTGWMFKAEYFDLLGVED